MRKTVKIRSREISVKLLVALIVGLLLTTSVVVALVSIGKIKFGYEITPTTPQAPTLTPSTINLDLGSIPSGSSGDIDFGKVATIELPVGYEITVALDTTTVSDFSSFDVDIYLYETGEPL